MKHDFVIWIEIDREHCRFSCFIEYIKCIFDMLLTMTRIIQLRAMNRSNSLFMLKRSETKHIHAHTMMTLLMMSDQKIFSNNEKTWKNQCNNNNKWKFYWMHMDDQRSWSKSKIHKTIPSKCEKNQNKYKHKNDWWKSVKENKYLLLLLLCREKRKHPANSGNTWKWLSFKNYNEMDINTHTKMIFNWIFNKAHSKIAYNHMNEWRKKIRQ